MKKLAVAGALAVLVLGLALYNGVEAAPKGEKIMVIGEVIDIANFAMKGWSGEEYAEAGQHHAEKGLPLGILEEETGKLVIPVYKNPAPASTLESANKLLEPYMGKKVVVQGLKYSKQGIDVIRISIVSEY